MKYKCVVNEAFLAVKKICQYQTERQIERRFPTKLHILERLYQKFDF